MGDSIYLLSVIRHIPDGPHDIQFVDQEGQCTRDFTKRTNLLVPLFEKQSYIKSAKNSKAPADIDFTQFRNFHGNTTTLPQAQSIHLGVKTGVVLSECGSEPWLKVRTALKSRSGIVISRSDRYHNESGMPWAKIVKHYGWSRITFVGLPDEHTKFCNEFGPVSHQPVKDFWELAQLVMASKLFIGNQSSPLSVAIGMGHRFIEECNEKQPDCIFKRDNAQYVIDGSCILPDIDGSGELKIEAPEQDISHFSRSLVPPGFWQYRDLPASPNFDSQKSLVAKLELCDANAADEMLLRANMKRVPEFFSGRGSNTYEAFRTAYAKAFGSTK